MGTDYYAYAVIGLKVDPKKLFKVTHIKVRACECDVDTSTKYCPDCGRRMFKTEAQNEFLYQSGEYGEHNGAKVCGYKVVWGTWHSSYDNKGNHVGYEPQEAIIAYAVTTAPTYGSHKQSEYTIGDLKMVFDAMKERLKSTGLWKDSNFGLHAVLYVSY